VIVIDDNADKVLESEAANLLLIPAWREDAADRVMPVLVRGLLSLDCTRDVRPQIKPIQDAVWRYFWTAYPELECSLTSAPALACAAESPPPPSSEPATSGSLLHPTSSMYCRSWGLDLGRQ